MGLINTLIYTSELILCSTICVPSVRQIFSRTNYGKFSTKTKIIEIWNKIPLNINHSSSMRIFNRRLACVASVSVEQRAKKQGFRRFARVKNGARAKIRWGRGRKEFPSFPSPTPLPFLFLLSPHFSRGQNTENPVSSLFAPWKRLLRRLIGD